MKIYDYFRSSAAYRLRIALNLKGLAADRSFIHLRRKEQAAPGYLAVNPMGLVPALEIDGRTLTQSLAVIEYLDETHPTPALLPADALGRARVRALALAVALVALLSRGEAGEGPKAHEMLPWFILGFLAMMALRSFGLLPPAVVAPAASLSSALAVVSMAALGLMVDLPGVTRAGGRVLGAGILSLLALAAMGCAALFLLHAGGAV